jgi:uncharacterized membrane protein
MSAYEVLLFGHILFVVAWVGTDIAMQLLASRAMAAGPQRTVEFLDTVEWIGRAFLAPVSIVVIVLGALLVNEAGYEFSQTWITLGFAGFIFSFLLGAGFLGPESARIGKLIDQRGPENAEVQSRIRRIVWLSRLELIVLIAVILDMVVKPGL